MGTANALAIRPHYEHRVCFGDASCSWANLTHLSASLCEDDAWPSQDDVRTSCFTFARFDKAEQSLRHVQSTSREVGEHHQHRQTRGGASSAHFRDGKWNAMHARTKSDRRSVGAGAGAVEFQSATCEASSPKHIVDAVVQQHERKQLGKARSFRRTCDAGIRRTRRLCQHSGLGRAQGDVERHLRDEERSDHRGSLPRHRAVRVWLQALQQSIRKDGGGLVESHVRFFGPAHPALQPRQFVRTREVLNMGRTHLKRKSNGFAHGVPAKVRYIGLRLWRVQAGVDECPLLGPRQT